MKFVKKPVIIDAWLTSEISYAATHDWENVAQEIKESYEKGGWLFMSNGSVLIPTLEGSMTANPDDYIIRSINGEFYPCKPDIFVKTYEAIIE